MFSKINAVLRSIFLIAGAIYVLAKLTGEKKIERRTTKEGFQTEEFDDIW